MELASTRARRAVTLMSLAVVAVTAAGAVYLGPGLVRSVHSASQPPAPPPTTAPRLQPVMASFADADHGAAAMVGPSSPPAIYETSNGGRSWTKHPTGAVTMTFIDRDHAVAWGPGRLETTNDGGQTWRTSPAPFNRGFFTALFGPGVVGGPTFLDTANAWWLDAGAGPPSLWRSIDGGRTWRRLAGAGIPGDHSLGQPVFIDPLRGAIVSTLGADSWPSVLTTQDAGETWREVSLPASPIAGAHLASPASLAATPLAHDGALVLSLTILPPGANAPSVIGPLGDARSRMVLRWSSVSHDGGLTWSPWAVEPELSLSTLSSPVFDDTGRLLLVDDQRLWISRDVGRSWQAQPMQMPRGERAVALFSARGGVLLALAWRSPLESPTQVPLRAIPGQLGLVRSRDGGIRWSEVPLPRS